MKMRVSSKSLKMTVREIPWQDPMLTAKTLSRTLEYMAFLFSGMQTSYSGRYSFLAWDLDSVMSSESFSELEDVLTEESDFFENLWFGYLGYDLKNDLEELPSAQSAYLDFANVMMMRFKRVIRFDHLEKTASLWTEEGLDAIVPEPSTEIELDALPKLKTIEKTLEKADYMEKVSFILEKIRSGDLYQANLTRKSFGSFEESPDPMILFQRLSDCSPAPYSSFLKMGAQSVISSSPEQFIKIDANGHVSAIPIKGSAPRGQDAMTDKRLREGLALSPKDRSENLMIVDLLRHDFSKGSELGSVSVDPIFQVTTYETIHHMSSTILAKKDPSCSAIDFVKHAFPPGSMTGAPKVMAMKVCAELERLKRGVYSGAIGYFAGDGSVDLSVVIRTLLTQDHRFEFQVGGGIVADSDPEKEWEETCTKEKGVLRALGLKTSYSSCRNA